MFFTLEKPENFSTKKQIYVEDLPLKNRQNLIDLLSKNGYIGDPQNALTPPSTITNGEIELSELRYYLFCIPKTNPLHLQFRSKGKMLVRIVNQKTTNEGKGQDTTTHNIAKIEEQRLKFNEKSYPAIIKKQDLPWEPTAPVPAFSDTKDSPSSCVLS